MKIKDLVILLLAGAVLAYGGVKGYVYYKVKQQLDRLVVFAMPYADIQYGSIGSTLDGVISISDIAVNPRGINDVVNIEQLRIITPGLEFLLNGGESMGRGEMPKHLGMQLQGAGLKLHGGLVQMMEKMEAEQTGKQPSAEQVCTLSRDFITAQYRDLGFKELNFDSGFKIERGAPSEIRFGMDYVLHGIEQGDFAMTFTGVGDSMQGIAMSTPLLKNVNFRYKPDPAFIRKALEYCAKRQETDVPTFVDNLFDKDDDYFGKTLGFIPGAGIRNVMRQLVQDGAELRIVAEPLSPLDLKTVHLYKPEDWPDLFGLSVTVDDAAITDLSFRVPGYVAGDESFFTLPGIIQKDATGRQEADKPASAESTREKKPNARPRYRVVDTKDIRGLVWKEVRILTLEGNHRDGRIIDVKNGQIYLEKRMRGGAMSVQVPVTSVRKIEVLE